jgi:glycosyltransferase involved in cell wall biosynthesis
LSKRKGAIIKLKIAVLIPCYNEELTIRKVISDFKNILPEAEIYVYDNNSKDKTAQFAQESGSIVVKEYRQGKGNVVRSMFRNIDADCYIMVDGDDTYPADFAPELIVPILNQEADMVIGDRLANGVYKSQNKRIFHNIGNILVRWLIGIIFKNKINDIMTGYRAFSRFFVKNMPVVSKGFEIETEMSIHALDKNFILKEIPIQYRDRPNGSNSKLNTYKDGLKVLNTIFSLFKDYKPLLFFSTIASIFMILGLFVGFPVISEFTHTHYITKIPSAILAAGLEIISIMLYTCAFILDTIAKANKKSYELSLIKYSDKSQLTR